MLAGLGAGAVIGWLAGPSGAIPIGLAGGLAVGVGLDSVLNQRINGPFDDPEPFLSDQGGRQDNVGKA